MVSDGPSESDKRSNIHEVIELLKRLSPMQVEVITSIIERFSAGFEGELVLTGLLNAEAFEYFGMRLAAHHAYSSKPLKKENFEHILAESFRRIGIPAQGPESMTLRGADLIVGNLSLSLKTEAARNLRADVITISKLMEAAWIKKITKTQDIPPFINSMVLPHFQNYDAIYILRSFKDIQRTGFIRYDLHEIPKWLLGQIGTLTASNFSNLTPTRTTSADVKIPSPFGAPSLFTDAPPPLRAFTFRLDGSDDKLTINNLDVRLCPLHAWWSLREPT